MNLTLSRLIGSILFAAVIWSIILRGAGITPIWQRLSTRAVIRCLITSIVILLAILALRVTGWVINGDEGTIGLLWLTVALFAVFAASAVARLSLPRRRRLIAPLALVVLGSLAGLAFAEESVRPTSDRTTWYWFTNPPARATLTNEREASTSSLHVVIYRPAKWLRILQRRVYDNWFSVPVDANPQLQLDSSRLATEGTVAIVYGGSVLVTVAIPGDKAGV